ncbi:hypothetical protein VHEMI05619 [[Torrubiella] hemipterigena]|uniref:Glycosyltransferase family 32 protein n=1 Tax=[Torrubiella] hemipterigena TaxID=1531966 RepID=A0A0A1T4Q8_9HYPO|nr:hypothetical protein VHEMI05619 [[Torrubiella] hemipterigena]
MRFRLASALAVATTLLALCALRHHIQVLRDIIHTYSAFYPLIREYPELLYKYPESNNESTAVPKIIHQVALGNGTIAKYEQAMESCRQLHPTWQFFLWTDTNATDFMAEMYPEISPHYNGYFQNIQRANVLRYAVLHTFGGVYLDLDITCLVALEATGLTQLPFVSPGAHPAGVNNAFILTQPGHSFLERLLSAIPRHDLAWAAPMRLPYIENMLSTGCMFFSNQWIKYAERYVSGEETESVMVLADKEGDIAPHMLRGIVQTPIMAHGGASSWHGWDAAAIVAIGKHYKSIVSLVAVGFTLAILCVLLRCLGTRVKRHKSWMLQGAEKGLLE